MSFSVEINGVHVASNKEVRVISNNRVTFADNSWCDVSTGEIHNVGDGYIRMADKTVGDPGGSSELVTTSPKYFKASALRLECPHVDVDVELHDGADMEVSVTGTADDVASIVCEVEAEGPVLVVSGGPASASSGTVGGSITVVRPSRWLIGRLLSQLFSSHPEDDGSLVQTVIVAGGRPRATIKVPAGTPVKLTTASGEVNLPDLNAPVNATLEGDGDVVAGRITGVRLHSKRNGSFTADYVDGDAVIRLDGSGDATIREGNIGTFYLVSNRNGCFDSNVTVRDATVQLAGSGDAELGSVAESLGLLSLRNGSFTANRVAGEIKIHLNGSGDATIHEGSATSLVHLSERNGSLNAFGLDVGLAQVTLLGSGDAELGTLQGLGLESLMNGRFEAECVNGDVKIHLKGSGDAIVHEGHVKLLSAITEHNGCVDVNVNADIAELETHGSGHVNVAAVRTLRRSRMTSTGQVEVGSIG